MAVGTTTRYFCGDEERRATLRGVLRAAADLGQPATLNGVDFLEVLDRELDETPVEPWRQRILLVQCYSDAGLDAVTFENARVRGERAANVRVEWLLRLADADEGVTDPEALARLERVPQEVIDFLRAYRSTDAMPRARILAVGTSARGDYATYRLALVDALDESQPLAPFDPRLSAVDFSFKVECASDFDCAVDEACPPETDASPTIDYLAKDFASFRRLMLDRLTAVAPDWRERSPADLGVALVELLAHVGDELSYYQDAVATEAYLGTARQRISVRRHARLVDYRIHEGTNARAWVVLEVAPASSADGATLPGASAGAPGTRLLTRSRRGVVVAESDVSAALREGAAVFEMLLPLTPRANLNAIAFHTWSDRACCLPIGATAATLRGELQELSPGDFLLFEEVAGPATGDPADADPAHRHVVRITAIERGDDPVVPPGDDPIPVAEVHWHPADALPFALCLSATTRDGRYLDGLSVARGNVTLADHGRTLEDEALPGVTADEPYRPRLAEGPLTHAVPPPEDDRPAAEATRLDPRDAVPAVRLTEDDGTAWTPQRDLLASHAFSRELVAEIENDGRARLRFGDGTHGSAPVPGSRFTATYRVGNGPEGNVGAGAIAHVVGAPAGVERVRNPLPATGGEAPESLEEIRRYAPRAFRVQERAVTPEDYARAAEQHPEVQRATASFRWTGSWRTVFVTLDRRGGHEVDAAFERELQGHLSAFRLAGYDLEITGPRFVPLDVELAICLERGHRASDVAREITAALGSRELPGGRRGHFHPDLWTFGQAVDLSPIYAAASAVEGVASVTARRFGRRGQGDDALTRGRIPIGRLEIAQLDNDPARPANGRLTLTFGGAA